MSGDTILTSGWTAPSSPTLAVFSDDVTRQSTPPSSPPGFPWETRETPAIEQETRSDAKSAFALLSKRKALDSISENARPAKKVATSVKTESKSLTQMQISLGQEVQKKCKACGMEYVPSSAEDRKLHDKYHKQNTEGYDVGKDFVAKTSDFRLFRGARLDDRICAVDRYSSYHTKAKGRAVLEIAQRELGAVDIPEDIVWDPEPRHNPRSNIPDYRAYLHIRGSKCIGLLLVRAIREAYRVDEPVVLTEPPADLSKRDQTSVKSSLASLRARQEDTVERLKRPIQLSEEAYPAQLGVSRVWTSSTHRRQNVASALLDAAIRDYNQRARIKNQSITMVREQRKGIGIEQESIEVVLPYVPKLEGKDRVAFSQPTEAGVRLARRWFGRAFGWKVYVQESD